MEETGDVIDYREWALRQVSKGKLTEKQFNKCREWDNNEVRKNKEALEEQENG